MLTSRRDSSSSGEEIRGPAPPEADISTGTVVANAEGVGAHSKDDIVAPVQAASEQPTEAMSHRISRPGDFPAPEVHIGSGEDDVDLATVSIHQPVADQPHSRADLASGPTGTATDKPHAPRMRAPLERLIIDGTDEGEDVPDPNAIGVAHTSNVPMPAPLSSPSIRKNSRPEEDRPSSTRDVPYAREVSPEDRGSSRIESTDPRRLRYDFVSQDPDPLDYSQKTSVGAAVSPLSETHKDATITSSRASGAVSPLNPLEELTEDLLEGLEEDEPADASYDRARSDSAVIPGSFVNGHSPQVESPTSSTLSTHKKRGSGSRASDARNPALSTASGSSADRASVQRVFTPPMTPREDSLPRSKRSESLNKGSNSPQLANRVKGVLSRHPDEPSKAGRTSRSSQEEGSRRETTTRSSHGEPRSREAERSFEQLIRSDETIQYTLTPPNMRDMEVS